MEELGELEEAMKFYFSHMDAMSEWADEEMDGKR